MSRRPVTLTMHLLTGKQREFVAGLSTLHCPDDEDCSVHVSENEQGGLTILLKLQKPRRANERWKVNQADGGWHTFETVFQIESATDIVEELRRILDTTPTKANGAPSS